MKKIAGLLAVILFAAGCAAGWDAESKEMYTRACRQGIAGKGYSETKMEAFCKCSLETVMKKYPTQQAVLENADKLANDKDLYRCKSHLE